MFPVQDTIPHRRPPVAMWGIILLNTVVFVFELSLTPSQLEKLFYTAGVVPALITAPWREGSPLLFLETLPHYVSFLTCMFLHGGWFHFISNMWALWIFGDNVEDRMGSARFLIFYILTGVIASVVHVVTQPDSPVPVVGASGAISGVMGAYMLFFPASRIVTLVPLGFIPLFFELPAVLFMFIWFLTQLQSGFLSLVAPEAAGGVAWWAHVGGFVAGVALCKFFALPAGYCRRCQRDEGVWESAWI